MSQPETVQQETCQNSELESQVLRLCDTEKRRIGQDLHDSVGQQLTGISLMSKALEHRLRIIDSEAADTARTISTLMDDAIDQIRNVISGMAPPEIQDQDAFGALEILCERIEDIHQIDCIFTNLFSGAITAPDAIKNLYFITEESVHNALRHGHATRVDVILKGTPENGTLQIINNGECNAECFDERSGIGLSTMKFRAHALNGTLDARCKSQHSAVVNCTFRIQPEPFQQGNT